MSVEPDMMSPGRAEVAPSLFEFPFVPLGRQSQTTIRVTNTGQTSVNLSRFASAFGVDYALFWILGREDLPLDEQNAGVIGGMNQMPESIVLEAGRTLSLTLLYTPSEMGQRGGHFVFWTDTEFRLPIEHSDDRPRLEPDSNPVVFESAGVGERKVKLLRVSNTGTAIATLDAVDIDGDDVFSITIDGRDPAVDNRVLYNPDRDPELGVGLGKAFEVLVRFLADEPGDYMATITILSDAENDELVVPLSATAITENEAEGEN